MITAVPGTSTTSTDTSSYTPTNYHKVKYLANTTDPGTSWHGSSSSSPSPSPYTATGTKSTVYHTSGQALADMDGKTNTDTIIAATTANWYSGSNDNSEKVVNSSNTGNYPAACCCRRYSCKNASLNFRTGNWYLPSVGELGYLVARFEEIDRSRRMLGSKSMFDTKLFSSTEYN